MEKSRGKLKKFFKIIKRVRLSTLIMLILLMTLGTYSWFIYNTKVATGLTAHVTAWKFDFSVDDQVSSTEIVLDLKQLYPGMPEYVRTVKATNTGEMEGELSYKIIRMDVLGQVYEVSDTVTSEDLMKKIQNEFPFSLTIGVDGTTGNTIPVGGFRNVNIKVNWPFDSKNDELDTKWGMDAYDFYQAHPGESSVKIKLLLTIKQPMK